MAHPAYKQRWQDRVKLTHNFHIEKCKQAKEWTIPMTAAMLNRATGSVAQDILIADFMKTYPQVEKFKNYSQALEWVREKKNELKLRAI